MCDRRQMSGVQSRRKEQLEWKQKSGAEDRAETGNRSGPVQRAAELRRVCTCREAAKTHMTKNRWNRRAYDERKRVTRTGGRAAALCPKKEGNEECTLTENSFYDESKFHT
uniref:Uncharacterized protein n=1 Tax=Plectus sambesii TaxID=2011161 RepID=A0A914V8V6_9BILA